MLFLTYFLAKTKKLVYLIWGHISPNAYNIGEVFFWYFNLWPIQKTSFPFSRHVSSCNILQSKKFELGLKFLSYTVSENKHFKGSFELLRLTCIKMFDVPLREVFKKIVSNFQTWGVLTRKFPKKKLPNFTFFLKTFLITCTYYDHQTPHVLYEIDQIPTPLQMLQDT